MKIVPPIPKFWMGTEESFSDFVQLRQQIIAFDGEGDMGEMPPAYELNDGVATIPIQGPLVSGSAGFLGAIFGFTGYNDIRKALVQAVSDPKVTSIMLDVNSGGGDASGVEDTSGFIKQISQIKPVVTFADGTMASAAYWLGSAADKVVSTATAVIGSIGVLATHMERSKMLAEDGIGVTVMRAGENKALANSLEPLSERGKEQIQVQLNDLHSIFKARVADNRNSTVAAMEKYMDGSTFLGQRAVEAGLVDNLASYEQAFAVAKSLGAVDNTPKTTQNRRNQGKVTNMPRASLTAEQVAILAAGGNIEQSANESADNSADSSQAATSAEATTDSGVVQTTANDADSSNKIAAPVESDLVSFLRTQLSEANAALVAAKVESAGLKTKVDDLTATHGPLLEIARTSINNMAVALGGSAKAGDVVSASNVVAEHARLSELFKARFPVGGVASTAGASKEDKPKPKAPALFMSLVKSAAK